MKRERNIDLLRIISILLITFHHLLINGAYPLNGCHQQLIDSEQPIAFILCALNSFAIIGVNLFFLISGYFSVKLKIEKIIKLWLDAFIIYTVIFILDSVFTGKTFTINSVFKCFDCLERYWFLNVYFLLIMLSPMINLILNWLDENKYKKFVLFALLIFCGYFYIFQAKETGINKGYSLVSAIYLYIIGAGIKKGFVKRNKKVYLLLCGLVYTIQILFQFIVVYKLHSSKISWYLFAYNNPLIFLLSIFTFIVFTKVKVRDSLYKIIDLCSPAVLSVYLIQSCGIDSIYKLRGLLLTWGKEHFGDYIGLLFLIPNALLIFFICVFLFKIKVFFLDSLENKLSRFIGNKITFLISCFSRINF